MHALIKTLVIATGALALATTSASASVVCNDEGDCWHSMGNVEYKPELKLHVHPDTWKFADKDNYKWREHEGRGYWKGGVWISL